MADVIQIKGPTALDFSKAFAYMEEAVRRGLVDRQQGTLPYQGRLLVKDIIAKTPPRKKGTGNKAVERSLRGLTRPLTQKQFTSEKLKKIVRKGDVNAWNIVSTRFKSTNRLKDSRATGFEPGFYQRSKNKPPRRLVYLQPEVKQFKSFVRSRQQSVGKGKAAWKLSYYRLGGPRLTSWIDKHPSKEGRFVDGMSGPNPRITVGNQSSWAKHAGKAEGVVRSAIKQRTRNMQRYVNLAMTRQAAKGMKMANRVLQTTKFFTG